MEIYEILKNDHREVKLLLEELLSLRDDDDYRFILIEEIRNMMVPHSRAEESVFYNTLRAVNADRSVIFMGYQEHLEAEALLRALQVMDRLNLDWKHTAEKLQRSVLRHIQAEENEIFEEARRIFTRDEAMKMGEAFIQLKSQIEKDGLLKNTVDMVINMMPPRLADKIRHFSDTRHH